MINDISEGGNNGNDVKLMALVRARQVFKAGWDDSEKGYGDGECEAAFISK